MFYLPEILRNIFQNNWFISQSVIDFINDTSIETREDVNKSLIYMEESDIKDLINYYKLYFMKPYIIASVINYAYIQYINEKLLINQLSDNMTDELLDYILDMFDDEFIIKLYNNLSNEQKNKVNKYFYNDYLDDHISIDNQHLIELLIENNIDYEYIDEKTKETKYLIIEMIKGLKYVKINNLHMYPRINLLLEYYILSTDIEKILPDITDDQYYDILESLYCSEMNRPFIEKVFLNGRILTDEILGLFLEYNSNSNYWNNLYAILSITNYLPDSDSIEIIIQNIVNEKDHDTFLNILELFKSNNTISFPILYKILLSPNIKYLNNIYDTFNINCYDFYKYILNINTNNKYIFIERFINSCKYISLHNIMLTSLNNKENNITETNIEMEFSFTKFTNTNRIFCYKENDIYKKIHYTPSYDNPFNYIPT